MKSALLKSLQQLVLKPRCTMCKRFSSGVLCPDCRHKLETCQATVSLTFADNHPLIAWGHYQGLLKQLLGRLKYDQQAQIAHLLGQLLGIAWLENQSYNRQSIVIPIPLHEGRQQERGYNQSALIAKSFCQVTGLNLTLNGLVRVKATAAQFNLSPQDRLINVAQAFQLGSELAKKECGKNIVLLDDIYTTGATIHSAVEALSQAGFKVSGIAVVAKA